MAWYYSLRVRWRQEPVLSMKCWHCKTKLIWGGDHDCNDWEDYLIVSNLSCPECNSLVLVYYPNNKEDENATCTRR